MPKKQIKNRKLFYIFYLILLLSEVVIEVIPLCENQEPKVMCHCTRCKPHITTKIPGLVLLKYREFRLRRTPLVIVLWTHRYKRSPCLDGYIHPCFLSDCSFRFRYGKKPRKIDPLCDYLVKHAKWLNFSYALVLRLKDTFNIYAISVPEMYKLWASRAKSGK
jgi:hypothetical protein